MSQSEIEALKKQLEEAKKSQKETAQKIKELEEKEEELRIKSLPLLDRIKEEYEAFGWYEIKEEEYLLEGELSSTIVEDSFESSYSDGNDDQSVVRWFPKLNAYFKFFGYYASYHGDEFECDKTIQVYPKQKTVTIFETKN